MRKTLTTALSVLVLLLTVWVALPATASDSGSWKGEVVDMACYIAKGAMGPGHADCAKKCVKNGEPMGLLTDDGNVILLAASHDNAAAFETLKDLAGSKAEVMGTLSERAGTKMITVTGAKGMS